MDLVDDVDAEMTDPEPRADRAGQLADVPSPPPDRPPAELRYRRPVDLVATVRELVGAREVVRSLVRRELRVRYSQAVLGLAWAVLAPLSLMVVFTVFVNRVAPIDSGDVPYALFAYVGLVPWTFFASAVSLGSMSLVGNVALLNKVYCPREVFPLASVLTASVDAVAASTVLVVLFAVYGRAPAATSYWLVVLLPLLLALGMAAALLVSIVTVYLRDVRHGVVLALQFALFATPVVYRLEEIPARFRLWYVVANPVAGVIEAIRGALLDGAAPNALLTGAAATAGLVGLLVALVIFKRMETGIADVA